MQLSTPVTDSLVEEVHDLVRTFSPDIGSAETDLLGTGVLDSANLVRLLLAVETQFAVTIPMEEVDIDSIRSIARIANLVRQRRSAEAAPEPPLERDSLILKIHELFLNSLSVEVPSPDEDLFRAGLLDSMLLVQLIMLLEDQFGLNLSLEDLDVAAFSTTAGIAQLVRQFANGAALGRQ